MQILHDTHIDFMKYRRFWIIVSFILVVVGFYSIFGPHKLNLGIDFAGGTQITLGFRDKPDVDRIRKVVEAEGFRSPVIQSIGKPEVHQVNIKTPVTKGTEEGSRDRIVNAISRVFNQGQKGLDLNQASSDALTQLLVQADPDHVAAQGPEAARAHYGPVAEAIYKERQHNGLFLGMDRVSRLPGVSPAVVAALQQGTYLGSFAVLGTENVGPQVGKELRRQGFWAVILSLGAMLAYIGFRFELRFGIGAIMASLHDVMVTLGLFTLMGYEFNLTTVAAFLTLIGYSTNDTVVIFDRVRENMRKSRRKPLIEVMNESINETLSRTIMTGGLTFLTVLSLLLLGGDVLRGFAFVMTIGIIVGTYSSIYVASPFALLWESLFGVNGKWHKGKPGSMSKGAPVTAGRNAPRSTPATPTPSEDGGEVPARPRRPRPARRRA
ncbi:MAG: preprotein translocase subunit SecF [Acidobacteriota bacterium]|jgi:preprotein translocase subunit SecF|nr:preprotein translocase subunit SecF [Acidobacteriota bacterium]